MLMLIYKPIARHTVLSDFNTSHVNVNRGGTITKKVEFKFQYISC